MGEKAKKQVLKNLALGGAMAVGAAGALAISSAVGAIIQDPLKPFLNPDGQVKPDELAKELANDPILYQRFKEVKTFVERIDQQAHANLYQGNAGLD